MRFHFIITIFLFQLGGFEPIIQAPGSLFLLNFLFFNNIHLIFTDIYNILYIFKYFYLLFGDQEISRAVAGLRPSKRTTHLILRRSAQLLLF